MRCSRAREQMSARLDGALEEGLGDGLDRHLEACAACKAALERLVAMRQVLAADPPASPSPDFTRRVVEAALTDRLGEGERPVRTPSARLRPRRSTRRLPLARPRPRWWPVAGAAAAALLVALSFGGWPWRSAPVVSPAGPAGVQPVARGGTGTPGRDGPGFPPTPDHHPVAGGPPAPTPSSPLAHPPLGPRALVPVSPDEDEARPGIPAVPAEDPGEGSEGTRLATTGTRDPAPPRLPGPADDPHGRLRVLVARHEAAALPERPPILAAIGQVDLEAAGAYLARVLVEGPHGEEDYLQRVAAARALGLRGDRQAADALYAAVTAETSDAAVAPNVTSAADLRDAAEEGLALLREPEVVRAVAVAGLAHRGAAVRAAVARGLGRGGILVAPAAVGPLLAALRRERDATVTGEMLVATGEMRDPRGLGALRAGARHRETGVRRAAARGLGFLGDPEGAGLLVRMLDDRSAPVRASAARALAASPVPGAIPRLVATLDSPDRRLAGASLATLQAVTGQSLLSTADWTGWWERSSAVAPPGEGPELVATRQPRGVTVEAGLYGLPLDTNAAVFLLDCSESMGSAGRLARARSEVASAIGRLDPATRFNVIAFADRPVAWSTEPRPAVATHQASALEFLARQVARSGTGTNTLDALVAALRQPGVDTVFLLSDGLPSAVPSGTRDVVARAVRPGRILAAVRETNRPVGARIHAVAFLGGDPEGRPRPVEGGLTGLPPDLADGAAMRFMGGLAADHDGELLVD